MFKPGDKVRCLFDAPSQFTKGKIYIVKKMINNMVCILTDDRGSKNNGWNVERFEFAYIKEFEDKLEKIIDDSI